jgi:hypothetical protein
MCNWGNGGRGWNSVVPLNQTAFVPPSDLHHSRAQIVYSRAQEKGEERGVHWNRIKWKARFGSAVLEPCLLNSDVNTFLRDSLTRFLTLGFFSWIRFPPAPVVHLDLQISPLIFEKIWNDPMLLSEALGEDYTRKKPEAKDLMILSL